MPDAAIVIGVDHYPGLTALHGPENDARAFTAWLEHPDGGGFAPDSVRPLLARDYGPPAAKVWDARPMQGDVIARFGPLVADAVRAGGTPLGQRLFIFFAGHGVASPDTTHAAGFVTAESQPVYVLATDVLRYADWFVRAGAFGQVIFLFDCCRSIAATTQPAAPALPLLVPTGARVHRFTAFAAPYGHAARERAFPPDGRTHGYFSRALLDALAHAESDAAGRVTGSAVKRFVHNRIGEYAERWSDVPDPEIQADPAHDVVFCTRRPATVPLTVAARAELAGRTLTVLENATRAVAGTPVVLVAGRHELVVTPGLYKVTVTDEPARLVEVTGATDVAF